MIRDKTLFYTLSFTWGLPMTLIGYVAAIVLRALGYQPKKWGYCYYFEVGRYWGGVNFGPIFITCKDSSEHTKNHELGHAHQNCRFGLLMPFIVAIPSAIRYWSRIWAVNGGFVEQNELPDYDSAWYEGDATKLGTEFMNWYNNNTK